MAKPNTLALAALYNPRISKRHRSVLTAAEEIPDRAMLKLRAAMEYNRHFEPDAADCDLFLGMVQISLSGSTLEQIERARDRWQEPGHGVTFQGVTIINSGRVFPADPLRTFYLVPLSDLQTAWFIL